MSREAPVGRIKPSEREKILTLKADTFGPWGRGIKIRYFHVLLFALLSGDFQWIHVNPWKARRGPYGGLIAHGGLTLAMLNRFVGKRLTNCFDATRIVDLGKDKVRNICVIPIGRKVRMRYRVAHTRVTDEGAFVNYQVQIGFKSEGNDVVAFECVVKLLFA